MDTLPLGPMLGALALAILLAALLCAVDAAVHTLAAQRPTGRNGDRPVLQAPLPSLILLSTLVRALAVTLGVTLGIYLRGAHGAWLGGLGTAIILLVLADYLPRHLAQRYPRPFIGMANALLAPLLKLVWPLAWLLDGAARLLVGDGHVIPLFGRPRPRGFVLKLRPVLSAWDSDMWALGYWYREA